MKKLVSCFFIASILLILVTFILGLQDSVFKEKYYTGVWYKDIIRAVEYYILWILPYWWLLIFLGSIIIGAIFYFLKK